MTGPSPPVAGLKYVPDGEMIEPQYRTLAKRILVNESRRELEQIHNSELITQKPHRRSAASFIRIWPQLRGSFTKREGSFRKKLQETSGFLAEVIVREFLSRISLNLGLNFVVSRATVKEDADYKYDFKIRVKHHIRGVGVQSKNVSSIGFQLKSKLKRGGVATKPSLKRRGVETVDEIITLKVPGKEFRDVVIKWLEAGEPSGGPEQFLSKKLKSAILKAVTEKLVDIPQEIFDKLAN